MRANGNSVLTISAFLQSIFCTNPHHIIFSIRFFMSLKVMSSCYINEQGKRKNNEDHVYPMLSDLQPAGGLYLVCDGVGGATMGEVASELACARFSEYFKNNAGNGPVHPSFVGAAVDFVRDSFISYVTEVEDARNMACTVTLLYLDDKYAISAHIGDSRIYQFRNGRIVFQTRDHSLVNELIARGEIEAGSEASFSKKNVITRAMSAENNSDLKADISVIIDVRPGDYFLLCTDGVLESFTNSELEFVFSTGPLSQIRDSIAAKCEENSRDNFSAYLIAIVGEASCTEDGPENGTDAVLRQLLEPITAEVMTAHNATTTRATAPVNKQEKLAQTIPIVAGNTHTSPVEARQSASANAAPVADLPAKLPAKKSFLTYFVIFSLCLAATMVFYFLYNKYK